MTLLSIPGPVDPHVHVRDLDWSYKATVASETSAALAGGYWAILDMPNTPPSTIDRARLAAKAARFRAQARCDFGLYLGAHGTADAAQYAEAAPDVVGLKLYCDETTGDLLVADDEARRAHLLAWSASTSKPLAVHAEGATLARVVDMARELGTRVHFCHVSTRDEIDRLRDARQAGAPVSVGVTPHHLYLTRDDADRLGPLGRVRPPLRSRADVDALWAAIDDGTVDVVESDHAPHTREEKASAHPPAGLPGLETTLGLLVLALQEARLSAVRLIELVATNAQRIFGLRRPPETWTLVDPSASWVVEESRLRTAPGWSPFTGMRLGGAVREVRIRGRVAFDGERVTVPAGFGESVA